MAKKIVYICSAFSGDPVGNTEKARRYSRFAVDQGYIPFAPHLLLPQYMQEETERDAAIEMDMKFLKRADSLFVFGEDFSAGMKAEIAAAKQLNMEIRYFTEAFKEVSDL